MPVWISKNVVLTLHAEQLAEHGGGEGLRDEGLLESALSRPENLLSYGDPDLADLAAAYAFGIARNHPFVDGNKRTSAVVAELFIELTGHMFAMSDAEIVTTWLSLAAGELPEEALAQRIRDNIT